MMLSKGEYLNHYDTVFDIPEAHVIKKDNAHYYAFYSKFETASGREAGGKTEKNGKPQGEKYSGRIHLRGLERSASYRITDYENNNDLGVIMGTEPYLAAEFDTHLLIKAVRE